MGLQLDILPISSWLPGKQKPIVISGPCRAESEEQVLQTASQLAEYGFTIFRCGIWKPRTRPNSFEGVGSIGINWLKEAKKRFGIKVAVEVANQNHVDECLQAGVDILWIGARTTVNPFTVQEIADALKGVDIPVLVKNPINPDFDLWIGAFERLNKVGINKLAGVHRGFSSYEASQYRNKPNWEIPLELKRQLPKLPLFCDPSHICGNRENIPIVAQRALDLAFEGLMIESHSDPDQALSDSFQQLKPHDLYELVSSLVVRDKSTDNPAYIANLEHLREEIDNIDEVLLDKIALRKLLVEEIAKYKSENNITIFQQERWSSIINNALKHGKLKNIPEDVILDLFKIIHRESIRVHNAVMNTNELATDYINKFIK